MLPLLSWVRTSRLVPVSEPCENGGEAKVIVENENEKDDEDGFNCTVTEFYRVQPLY